MEKRCVKKLQYCWYPPETKPHRLHIPNIGIVVFGMLCVFVIFEFIDFQNFESFKSMETILIICTPASMDYFVFYVFRLHEPHKLPFPCCQCFLFSESNFLFAFKLLGSIYQDNFLLLLNSPFAYHRFFLSAIFLHL